MSSDPTVLLDTARRRTFAIISHPDAGKTTLTEKFLLYAGAVHEAGAVRSRKQARKAVSDWMALEKERGISISSTVLHFAYSPGGRPADPDPSNGWRFNLLDTPGHADFSEDTYRTLCAADAAVMVLDNAKGLEPQTLKLFKVCRDRGLPIVTFVNKCDRPGLPPLGLLDEIETEIGLEPVPLTWPVADGAEFAGIIDRSAGQLVRFDRTVHGATVGDEHRVPVEKALADGPAVLDAPGHSRGCPPDRWEAAFEELELLELEGRTLERDAFLEGIQTPVFFGSALANFGVRLLLEGFAERAPSPGPAVDVGGRARELDAPFSAMVFKVQANMNPRHRDRVAFMRVQSGRFERGMTATLARSGRAYQLKYAHHLFAQDRETVETAVPGDIVGVVNATGLQVGDTLHDPDAPVVYPAIPTFAPERFARVRNRDTSRYKQFRSGLRQLDEEGVVHVLRRPELGEREPIFAGVGQLQFEVASYRMANEFGAEVALEPAPWQLARGIDSTDADKLRNQRGAAVVETRGGELLVLFTSDHALRWAQQDHPGVAFAELGLSRST